MASWTTRLTRPAPGPRTIHSTRGSRAKVKGRGWLIGKKFSLYQLRRIPQMLFSSGVIIDDLWNEIKIVGSSMRSLYAIGTRVPYLKSTSTYIPVPSMNSISWTSMSGIWETYWSFWGSKLQYSFSFTHVKFRIIQVTIRTGTTNLLLAFESASFKNQGNRRRPSQIRLRFFLLLHYWWIHGLNANLVVVIFFVLPLLVPK
jgi:hypothetical protein